MRNVNSNAIFFILFILMVLSSCNTSLNILDRKHRPGYTIEFFNKTNKKTSRFTEQKQIQICAQSDSIFVQNNYDNVVASSSNGELFISHYSVPCFVMPCDTPPKKDIAEPWSLYREKEVNDEGKPHGKLMEPFNLMSFAVILLGVILASLLTSAGTAIFLSVMLSILILSLISIIRIRKHPKKYSSFSKVFSWIFFLITAIPAFIALILLFAFGV